MKLKYFLYVLLASLTIFTPSGSRAQEGPPSLEEPAPDETAIRTGAEAGDARMQVYLGYSYLIKEPPEARREGAYWLHLAAEQGLADASYLLGNMHYRELTKEGSLQAAVFFRQAAEKGHREAQYLLGKILVRGLGVPDDRAIRFGADEQNHRDAQWEASKDLVEAIRWFAAAAEQNDPDAQYELGQAYATGKHIPQDYVKAVRLLRDSTEQGNTRAAKKLRQMYAEGQGVPKDKRRARQPRKIYGWTVLGAYQMFFLYTRGHYVPANEAAALQFLRAAADIGYAPAQRTLAGLYDTGTIVERSEVEAVAWYTKAAQQDHGGAQRRLAELHHSGQDGIQDSLEAYKWLLILRSKGDDEPASAVAIEASANEEEKARALKWAKKWKPRQQ